MAGRCARDSDGVEMLNPNVKNYKQYEILVLLKWASLRSLSKTKTSQMLLREARSPRAELGLKPRGVRLSSLRGDSVEPRRSQSGDAGKDTPVDRVTMGKHQIVERISRASCHCLISARLLRRPSHVKDSSQRQ